MTAAETLRPWFLLLMSCLHSTWVVTSLPSASTGGERSYHCARTTRHRNMCKPVWIYTHQIPSSAKHVCHISGFKTFLDLRKCQGFYDSSSPKMQNHNFKKIACGLACLSAVRRFFAFSAAPEKLFGGGWCFQLANPIATIAPFVGINFSGSLGGTAANIAGSSRPSEAKGRFFWKARPMFN